MRYWGAAPDGAYLGIDECGAGQRRAVDAACGDDHATVGDAAAGFLLHLLHFDTGTLALLLGLLGYVASMACWFFALKRLPLAKAYALLSLSYMVVWLAAILLPGWHEPFSWRGLLGLLLLSPASLPSSGQTNRHLAGSPNRVMPSSRRQNVQ